MMGMGNGPSPMYSGGMGTPISPPHSFVSMASPSTRPVSSGIGGVHGGRFTGDYMATRGAANGRPIMEGGRGGLYYINSNGNPTYLRK